MALESSKARGFAWWPAVLLFAVTVLAYQPAWRAGFIWDDDVYVTQNRLLTASDGLKRIWFSLDSPSQYFPLVYTVLRVERGLWGLDSEGYHWINILLHAANALLLWRLLRRVGVPASWLAAAIFALHPVEVESVAWVTELKNVLSLFFCLLAARAWVEFVEDTPGRRWFYVAALGCQALALAAKTTACTLPAALFLLLWLRHKPIRLARWAQLAPFLALGVALGLVTVWWERYHQFTSGAAFSVGLAERVLIASRAVWFYVGKLLWPSHLSFSYSRWSLRPENPLAWSWLAGGVAVAGLIFAGRKKWGRGPETVALYFVATLSPLLGFIMEYTFRYTYVADHYQYAASIGPLALAAAGIDKFFSRFALKPGLRPLGYAALLTLIFILTWRQCRVYASSETLWQATLRNDPESFIARNNLSQIYLANGRIDEAIRLSREALAIDPTDAVGELNLGYGLLQKGQLDDAITHCKRALALQPNGPDAYYDIGQAYLKKDQMEAAVTNFQMAVQLKPDFANACCNLGYALLQTGRIAEAIANYEKALALDPDYALAHNDLGSILLRQGETNQALAHFQRAAKLAPDFAEAHYNAGALLLRGGQLGQALSQFEKLAELRPQWREGHFMLGRLAAAYAANGRVDQAAVIARHALQLAETAHETELASRLLADLRTYQAATPGRGAAP
jgi:tetratricopeptide (TPR) repeat protein